LEVSSTVDVASGGYVLLAGLAIDLLAKTLHLPTVSKLLLDALMRGERDFMEYVDYLSGRYIIIYRKPGSAQSFVIGDATNMLKINYSKTHRLCSSNIFLMDELMHGGERVYRNSFRDERRFWKYG